ncbi:hypothetical protein [Spirosoma sp. KNUC1025]|uniref:hypothetical protein n=1 Tax=Spirosoma sp. KNUC1025 TaxID=2894082 RepID=UPI0038643809|nr:hypothetical protein LN737_11700 [Spirosoma sp. KNUC1025]
MLRKISHFDSNHRLTIALVVALSTFFIAPAPRFTSIHLTIVWIAFAQTMLILAGITIFLRTRAICPAFHVLKIRAVY